ncbi:sterol desaturase family protein [Thermoactinospora rubra]|uniref:sterol desaturase family protein n=1 Tax=Thermoactinospora rubra TaxID=1088767 RepID=UPI000A116CF1|nr:sterol desaturase family protein [Thermoactinospora rubra]
MITEQQANEFRRAGLTLDRAARIFLSHRNARILLPATAAAVLTRVALGRWSRRDLTAAAWIVGVEPFVEWMIHVHLLHQRPRRIRGRTVELFSARGHREHHRNPRDPAMVFIPGPLLAAAVATLVAANAATARSLRPAATGVAVSMLSLSLYEWTHFLIHSAYRPRTGLFRLLRRTHQLHHYRNENYWFGIITPISDHVFNTYPPKEEVPPSPTVKTLGVEEPAAS